MNDDLISRQALYENTATLEAQALEYVGRLIERDGEEMSTEWKIWSAILTERTAFKHDVYDAPPAQQWIPCSEGLPEFDELVLVWVENKDPKGRFNRPGIHTAQLRDRKPEHDPEGKKNVWGIPGYDSEWTVWGWSYFSEPDVKAWMPLPEPYKED